MKSLNSCNPLSLHTVMQASKFNCEDLEKRVGDVEASLAELKKQQ